MDITQLCDALNACEVLTDEHVAEFERLTQGLDHTAFKETLRYVSKTLRLDQVRRLSIRLKDNAPFQDQVRRNNPHEREKDRLLEVYKENAVACRFIRDVCKGRNVPPTEIALGPTTHLAIICHESQLADVLRGTSAPVRVNYLDPEKAGRRNHRIRVSMLVD